MNRPAPLKHSRSAPTYCSTAASETAGFAILDTIWHIRHSLHSIVRSQLKIAYNGSGDSECHRQEASKQLRIGINTLAAVPGRSGGDGTYTRYLVEHLAKIDSDNQYFLFVAPYNVEWFQVNAPNFHRVMCPLPLNYSLRVLWEHTVLGAVADQMKLDVFHGPVNITPALLRTPSVITIHDAIHLRRDSLIPLPIRLYWRFMRPRSAHRASRTIVVSETNRQELAAIGMLDGDKTTVIYNGVHERFKPLDRDSCREWVRQTYGVDQPFIVWVGRSYPSKNLPRMVEAFARFNATQQNRYLFLLAGPSGWQDQELASLIDRLQVGDQVRRLGQVPNEQLPQLYNAAEALLFASLQEACPFPPIEAMACGTPVITSNVSSLPEIMGGAGELVDPLNVSAITKGIRAAVCNQLRWADLRSAGLARARAFTWEQNAKQTLALYNLVAELPRPAATRIGCHGTWIPLRP